MPFFAKEPRGRHARGAHAKGANDSVSRNSAPLGQNNQQNPAGNRTSEGAPRSNNQRAASFDQTLYQGQNQSPYAGYVSRLRPSGGQTTSAPAQNTTRMPSQAHGGNARGNVGNTRANAGNARANVGNTRANAGGARTNAGNVRTNVGNARANTGNVRGNAVGAYTTPTVRPMYQQPGGWQNAGNSSQNASIASSSTSPEPPKNKSKKWRVIFIISLIVLLVSAAALGAIAYQYWSQQQAYSDLESYAEVTDQEAAALSDLSVDWAALQEVNPDVVAWIYIPGTPVNYPIVQGSDNDEYLHKAFDGSTGWLASAGTIFLDSINDKALSDQNNALYGHHMNDGSMFASVADWVDNATFNSQRDIYIMTPEGNYRLKTFAVVKTVGTDAIVQTTFSSKVQFVNYIQDKIDRSVVTQEGTVLQAHDVKQSFLLSTCEYSRDDGRVVAFAAVVETTVPGNPYLDEVEEGSTGITQDQAGSIAQAA